MKNIMLLFAIVLVLFSCRTAPVAVTSNAAEITSTQAELAQAVTETTETTNQAVIEATELVSIIAADCPSATDAAQAHLLTMNKLAMQVALLNEKDEAARLETVRLLKNAGIVEKAYYEEREERKQVTTQRNVAIACFVVTLGLMSFSAFKRLYPG